MDKAAYLCWLQNKFGDYKIAIRFRDVNNTLCWSKRYSVKELHLKGDDKSRWLLDKATDRTPLDCECILDYDLHKIDTDITAYIQVNYIVNKLSKYKLDMYFSGSKGYHVHVKIPYLFMLTQTEREHERAILISKMGCDFMKKSDNSMIAIEHNPHPKTNIKKRRVINKWLTKMF